MGSTTSQADAFLASNFLRCPLIEKKPSGGVNVQQVTVTLNPAAVSPGGQTTVTVAVQPAASGIGVSLSEKEVLDSGGHQHLNRPSGTFGSASGTTDSNGNFSTQYTASAFGGSETITATANSVPGTQTLVVAITGLALLGSGSNYSLIGSTATHPSNQISFLWEGGGRLVGVGCPAQFADHRGQWRHKTNPGGLHHLL